MIFTHLKLWIASLQLLIWPFKGYYTLFYLFLLIEIVFRGSETQLFRGSETQSPVSENSKSFKET